MMPRPAFAVTAVFTLAVVAAFLAARVMGPIDRPATGDGLFFAQLGQSLAAGTGYTHVNGPWRGQPHLARLPLWPAILSVPMRIAPRISLSVVLRGMTAVMHGVSAILLLLLLWRIRPNPTSGLIAGTLFAGYPPALSLVEGGYSEHAWLVAFLAGLLLLVNRPLPFQAAGALCMGLSVLSRTNIILLPAALAGCAILLLPGWKSHLRRWAVLSAIFLLPAAAWMARNYAVSGAFPLLSAQEGETLYGANNILTAHSGRFWGYWVFPDDIPGERPKRELMNEMSEAALNNYYRQKGLAFLLQEPSLIPWMEAGKVVRGFLPVPWSSGLFSYLASLPRLLLYGVFLWILWRDGIPDQLLRLLLPAILAVTLFTTLLFYGTYRFTFCLEPFLIASVAIWLSRKLPRQFN